MLSSPGRAACRGVRAWRVLGSLTLWLWVATPSTALEVLYPPRLAGKYRFGPAGWFGPEVAELLGNVTVGGPEHLCGGASTRVCGQPPHYPTVMLSSTIGDGCSHEDKARVAARVNCKALIAWVSGVPGISLSGPWQFDGRSTASIDHMIVQNVDEDIYTDMRDAALAGEQVTVFLYRNQTAFQLNEYYRMWNQDDAFYVIARVLLPTFQGLVLLFTIYRMYLFLRFNAKVARRSDSSASQQRLSRIRSRLGLPILVLSLEVLGGALRLAYMAVDPVWLTHVYNRMENQVLFSASFPYAFMSTLLIVVFWRANIVLHVPEGTAFLRHKWIILISAVALVAFETVSAILRGLFFSDSFFQFVNAGIYLVVQFVLALVFIGYGSIVITRRRRTLVRIRRRSSILEGERASKGEQRLSREEEVLQARSRQLKQVIRVRGQQPPPRPQLSSFVVGSAVNMLLFSVCLALAALGITGAPFWNATVFVSGGYTLVLGSLFRVMVLVPPAKMQRRGRKGTADEAGGGRQRAGSTGSVASVDSELGISFAQATVAGAEPGPCPAGIEPASRPMSARLTMNPGWTGGAVAEKDARARARARTRKATELADVLVEAEGEAEGKGRSGTQANADQLAFANARHSTHRDREPTERRARSRARSSRHGSEAPRLSRDGKRSSRRDQRREKGSSKTPREGGGEGSRGEHGGRSTRHGRRSSRDREGAGAGAGDDGREDGHRTHRSQRHGHQSSSRKGRSSRSRGTGDRT